MAFLAFLLSDFSFPPAFFNLVFCFHKILQNFPYTRCTLYFAYETTPMQEGMGTWITSSKCQFPMIVPHMSICILLENLTEKKRLLLEFFFLLALTSQSPLDRGSLLSEMECSYLWSIARPSCPASKLNRNLQTRNVRMARLGLAQIWRLKRLLDTLEQCLSTSSSGSVTGPCCSWESWSEWSPCIGCGSQSISRRSRLCRMDDADAVFSPLAHHVL